jgi:hypothetical protein
MDYDSGSYERGWHGGRRGIGIPKEIFMWILIGI